MKTSTLRAILNDIDNCSDGDEIQIQVITSYGQHVGDYSTYLLDNDVLIITRDDTPPAYVSAEAILSVLVYPA